MPSPQRLAQIRARVCGMITESFQREQSEDELDEQIRRLAVENGRPVLNILLTVALNGMRELQRAIPGAHMGGIAGHLQNSVMRFGEPWASIVMDLTEAMRLANEGAPQSADQKIADIWRKWGPDAVAIGVSLIVTLYGEIAAARGGIGMAQAWTDAVAQDELEVEKHLAKPLIVAEQRLWDSGFTEREYRDLLTRIQTTLIDAEAFGRGSSKLADLAGTPERREAVLGLVQAIKDERDGTGGQDAT